MKYMAEKGKIAAKKWVLGVKSGDLGVEKYELTTKLERLNGAKRRYSS